jgi:hypothetical protein
MIGSDKVRAVAGVGASCLSREALPDVESKRFWWNR